MDTVRILVEYGMHRYVTCYICILLVSTLEFLPLSAMELSVICEVVSRLFVLDFISFFIQRSNA